MKANIQFTKHLLCISAIFMLVIESYGQKDNFPAAAYPFGSDYVSLLYKKDSILTAKNTIRKSIEQSLHKKDSQGLVIGYNAIATLYEKLGNYEISKDYYIKSLQYVHIKNELKICLLQNKLLNVYIKGKFYASFDSLYAIAQTLSEKLQTENTFKNYLLKTMKYFALHDFDSLYSFTESTLPIVKRADFEKLTYSKDLNFIDFQKFILYQLRLYNAFSQIKQKSIAVQSEGYKNFLELSNDSLIASFAVTDREIYSLHRISSLLLNYKAEYYFDNGIYDSAAALYAKADNQKYRAITEYEERLAINGSLLYQAAKDEEEIAYKRDILEKEKKLFLTYKLLAGGALISSFILLSFLVYYSRSQKRIKLINNKLILKNDELLNYDKERKRFFEIVSHELRTPVYGINGLAAMMETEKNPDERQRYFASLKHTAQHISMFVDNILQGSKYNFDDRKLDMRPVNIRTQMENIYSSIYVFVKEKSLEFKHTISIHSGSLILLLDVVALNQIIINLLYNAIKNSDYGKIISFKVSEISRTTNKVALQFDIIDEGSGLNYSEDISEFTLYKQQNNIAHAKSGRGIGLIIVQQLIKYYNSELFVKSTLNEGTHFRFTLLLSIYKTSKQPYQHPLKVKNINQEKRVLIVDDNPLNLLISRKAVEGISPLIKVTTADSGAKAIDLVRYINFDLLLIDLNMPDKDGFETTLDIKAINKFIPIVALTALSYNNVFERAQEVGMEDVITKPYNLKTFKKIITHYLTKS